MLKLLTEVQNNANNVNSQNRIVPDCIQKLFQIRQSKYELRGMCMFTKIKIRTNVKQRCISVKGENMWNALDEEI